MLNKSKIRILGKISKKNNTQLSKKILSNIGVFDLYTSNYKLRIHGRELTRLIKGNQKTISNKLSFLAKNNILKCERRGSMKNYYLNLENPIVFNLIVIAEEYKAIQFLSGNFLFLDMFTKIKELVKECVIVFGSYARKDFAKSSDLDLLILGNYDKKKFKDMVKIYPIKVHVMQMNKKTFENGLFRKENFMLEVLKHHIIVKGSCDLVDSFWRYYNG